MYLVYSFCVAKTFVVEVSGSEALKLAPIYVRICRAEMHVVFVMHLRVIQLLHMLIALLSLLIKMCFDALSFATAFGMIAPSCARICIAP